MQLVGALAVEKGDGDTDILFSTDLFIQTELVIGISGLPSTWEIAGTAFQLINVGTETEPNYAIADAVTLYAHQQVYINWKINSSYLLKLRFVKYIRESMLNVYLPQGSVTPPPSDGMFLDGFPGASVFALEQYYSDFAGPFFSGSNEIVARIEGNVYSAYVDFDVQVSPEGAITSATDDGAFSSDGDVQLSANRFVCAVLKTKSSTGDSDGRGEIVLEFEKVFQIRESNSVRIYAPRIDGVWQAVTVDISLVDDEFFLVSFLVNNGSLQVYSNGNMVLDQLVQSLASANGQINVYLKGVDYKFLATWPDTDIPSDIGACMNSIMNYYEIT